MGRLNLGSSATTGARSLKRINPHLVRTFAPAFTRLFRGGTSPHPIFASVRDSRRSATVIAVCTILSACASSGSTQAPQSAHLDSLSQVNIALQGYALMRVDKVPTLVGPQR